MEDQYISNLCFLYEFFPTNINNVNYLLLVENYFLVIVLDNLKGKANDNFITSVGSRLLVYAKNKALNNYCFNKIENNKNNTSII